MCAHLSCCTLCLQHPVHHARSTLPRNFALMSTCALHGVSAAYTWDGLSLLMNILMLSCMMWLTLRRPATFEMSLFPRCKSSGTIAAATQQSEKQENPPPRFSFKRSRH